MEIQKIEYFEIEKSFLDEIENIFDNILRAISWSKKENQQMEVIIYIYIYIYMFFYEHIHICLKIHQLSITKITKK